MKLVMHRRWLLAIMTAAALAFATKVAITSNTYGATDALLWETNLQTLHHDGALALYRNGTILREAGVTYHSEVFNHPPFMVHLLISWSWLSDVSGLPLRFWLRFTCAVADLASLILLVGILTHSSVAFQPAVLFMLAASPVSVLISGFHGNTDPIMVAFLLLSLYLLATERPAWLAGAALGMAISIKIVPVIFTPAIFLFLRGRKRVEVLGGAAGVFIIGSLPMIAQDPLLIWSRVFGYSPQTGIWGLSRFVFALAPESWLEVYARLARVVLLGLLVVCSVWMNTKKRRPPLALQCGFLAVLLLALTPGFGVQYLAWIVPWTAVLTFRQALAFHAASGFFLFSYYNCGAHGFPWYLANSAKTQVWYGSVILLGLLCWLIICILVILFARKLEEAASVVT